MGGTAILTVSELSKRFGGVRIQLLPQRAARWAVGAVWRKRDDNPALHRFLELLQTEKIGA